MVIENNKYYKAYKRYESLFMFLEGLLIIFLLSTIWIYVYEDIQLKREISEKCGWGDDDYFCYCEKNEANRIKNLLENNYKELNLSSMNNVKVDS